MTETLPAVTAAREALAEQQRWMDSHKHHHSARKTDVKRLSAALRDLLAVVDRQGSCWDEGPVMSAAEGECAPTPPRCVLPSGHSGAHRGDLLMPGVATEWMHRDSYNTVLARAEAAEAEVDRLTAPVTDAEVEALARTLFEWDTEEHPDPKPSWSVLTQVQRDVWLSGAAAVVAASGRRHLPTEPDEREWGLISPDAHPGQYGRDDRAHLVSRNREHVERQHRRGHPSIMLAHRRKPGPWEVCDEQ